MLNSLNAVNIVEEGKTWIMKYHNAEAMDLYPDYEYKYFIEGDTLINGKEYKKLYSFNVDNQRVKTYVMALREEYNKVFFLPTNSTKEYLLYDFGLAVGSTVMVSNVYQTENSEISIKVIDDRVLNINGVERRLMKVCRILTVDNETYTFPAGWWIEGIGSELGLLNNWIFKPQGNNFFYECSIGEKTLFSVDSFNPLEYDLNDDGFENVGDISVLYTFIAGKNNDNVYTHNSDLNGDDTVNVGDVSKLYEIILGQ